MGFNGKHVLTGWDGMERYFSGMPVAGYGQSQRSIACNITTDTFPVNRATEDSTVMFAFGHQSYRRKG